MPAQSTLILAGLAWVGVLFAVALLGERYARRLEPIWPSLYALSLAVYCTAWTFYGTVGQAGRHGWWIPPTFLGTALAFLLAAPFFRRLIESTRRRPMPRASPTSSPAVSARARVWLRSSP